MSAKMIHIFDLFQFCKITHTLDQPKARKARA